MIFVGDEVIDGPGVVGALRNVEVVVAPVVEQGVSREQLGVAEFIVGAGRIRVLAPVVEAVIAPPMEEGVGLLGVDPASRVLRVERALGLHEEVGQRERREAPILLVLTNRRLSPLRLEIPSRTTPAIPPAGSGRRGPAPSCARSIAAGSRSRRPAIEVPPAGSGSWRSRRRSIADGEAGRALVSGPATCTAPRRRIATVSGGVIDDNLMRSPWLLPDRLDGIIAESA